MADKPIVVAVGSKNPVKVNSVKNAVSAAFGGRIVDCHSFDVPSGVPDQPWGDDETRQGALARAQAAHEAFCAAHSSAPDFAVGLEGGVGEDKLADAHPTVGGLKSVVSCFAFMAVLSAGPGLASPRWGVARTASFALPPKIVQLMRGEPPMELGDADDKVFSDINSKQKGGTVGKLTKGLIDRTAYYEHALLCALSTFMHDDTDLFTQT